MKLKYLYDQDSNLYGFIYKNQEYNYEYNILNDIIGISKKGAKKMKKAIIILFLIFNFLSLTGCDPSSYRYNYEDLKNNVSSVELINYDNDNAIVLFEKRNKVKSFDFSKMILIDVLSEEKIDDFILGFFEINFLLIWKHLDSPQGNSVKLNYNNGSFDIICCMVDFSCQYDSLGNVKYFIGSGGGNKLIELVEYCFNKNLL